MALELLSVKANLFLLDPLANLDESSRRRFVALLFLLSVKKYWKYQINVFPHLTESSGEEEEAQVNEVSRLHNSVNLNID